MPNCGGPAESVGGRGVQRSGWSGRYASIGLLAWGPAPGRVPRRGRPKIRRASDSIVAALFSAGTGVPTLGSSAPARSPPAGSSFFGSSPLERAASGGALASGSGARCSFTGGGENGRGIFGGGGGVGAGLGCGSGGGCAGGGLALGSAAEGDRPFPPAAPRRPVPLRPSLGPPRARASGVRPAPAAAACSTALRPSGTQGRRGEIGSFGLGTPANPRLNGAEPRCKIPRGMPVEISGCSRRHEGREGTQLRHPSSSLAPFCSCLSASDRDFESTTETQRTQRTGTEYSNK